MLPPINCAIIASNCSITNIRSYSAVRANTQLRVDIAVISISAIDSSGTLLDFDVREMEMSRAIIEHARKIVLVADSSKFSRSAPVRIAHLSEIDVPSNEVAKKCAGSATSKSSRPADQTNSRPSNRKKLEAEFKKCERRFFRLSWRKCSL